MMKLNENFLAQMREATELLRTSGPAAATEAIQRALGAAVARNVDAWQEQATTPDLVDINPVSAEDDARGAGRHGFLGRLHRHAGTQWRNPRPAPTAETVDEVEVHDDASKAATAARQPRPKPQPEPEPATGGRFLSGTCTNQAGTRAYKLYVPSGYRGEPLPLIVMLHGCKQHPDDFAAGTKMNLLGEQRNCLVLYPAQASRANGSNCWNWFNPADQQRDRGEPSLIADMTRQIMREYRVDPDRVYVAGLSAGGAMAAIMASTYPDLYAAVGIHSGLPVGSAHDVASAFGAMNGGHAAALAPHRQPVPTIVFHGDRDRTVHPHNGRRVITQSISMPADVGPTAGKPAGSPNITRGKTAQGRAFSREVFLDGKGQAIAEHWEIHGAGHAWSGGSKAGSYTDPKGPDASSEMLRFFLAHPKTPSRQ